MPHFPIPFIGMSDYAVAAIEAQISVGLLWWSHAATAIIGIIFALFLYRITKKLSARYLLWTTITFGVWSYLDFVTWGSEGDGIMFAWSILDIFSGIFTVLTYWFLYAFLTGKDLPLWQKVFSVSLLIPIFVYTLMSLNINSYYNPEAIALEVNSTLFYVNSIQVLFLFGLFILSFRAYTQAKTLSERFKAIWGGLGAMVFLSTFSFTFFITNLLLTYEIGTANEAYNISVYALFGMPFLVAFLGYLIAKYQAFDLRLSKTIGLIVLLMSLLFLGMFV
jgi:hypothetical protein